MGHRKHVVPGNIFIGNVFTRNKKVPEPSDPEILQDKDFYYKYIHQSSFIYLSQAQVVFEVY